MAKINPLELIIEADDSKELTGRVTYNGNLIVDSAGTVDQLEEKIKNLLQEFEGIDPSQVEFEYQYDVYALFQKFDYLNISKVAQHAGINPGLLRQYASGVKNPSKDQALKIESTLHRLADELQDAQIFVG
ncbi:MAG TPA: helix-turn-helix transcriptional regulator [Cyclobacteriaceae bacterium]|nr:helix-turn-helix transcriptional regulator [Cyclobacteriaceae bacterium]